MRRSVSFSVIIFFFALAVFRPGFLRADEKKPENAQKVKEALQDLQSSDVELRREAAVSLTRLGPDAKEAVPFLVKTLKDSDSRVRQNSIDALGEIGVPSDAAVAALMFLLKDEEYLIRLKAAETLGKFGKASGKAASSLVERLNDPKAVVRGFVIEAVCKVLEPEKAVLAVAPLLNDPDSNVRRKAKIGLEFIATPEAKKILQSQEKQKGSKRK